MKFNFLQSMFLLCFTSNTSAVEAQPKKTLEVCISSSTCRTTLTKQLKDNGHREIAEALKDAKTEDDAKKAVDTLPFSQQISLAAACRKHKEHLKNIIKK